MQLNRRQFLQAGAAGTAAAVLPWGATLAGAAPSGPGRAAAALPQGAWQFGVMADTQWKANLDGKNPGTCAVGIINALNQQFIGHGVKFVIQVGDLVDVEHDGLNGNPGVRTLPVRAAAAQALYDAGIGFFPLRGNHEGSATAANEMPVLFPQVVGQGSNPMAGATNFASPSAALAGLTYSFDVSNVRFVMLDQFNRRDGSRFGRGTNDNIVDQVPWIDQQLTAKPADYHGFVLAHKNLVGQNHTDVLFGANPAENQPARDAFIRSLHRNGVRYTLGGHDHVHHRGVVYSSDLQSEVKELIASSNSYKFYTPKVPSNDEMYNGGRQELVVAQELWTVGYYIVTVDGPRLWVDFYSSSHGSEYEDTDLKVTPEFKFYWRERWGYSLNGKEFVVRQGQPYNVVRDQYQGTVASLAGVNRSTELDYANRPMVKTVNTGWSDAEEKKAASAVLHLWGINDNLALNDPNLTGLLPDSEGSRNGDKVVLSMSITKTNGNGHGGYRIVERDAAGNWVLPAERNTGGQARFVMGPVKDEYPLGTYGTDPSTMTAWAVIDHDGVYAVRRSMGK